MSGLKDIMTREIDALRRLLELLEEQYRLIISKEIFSLETAAEEIRKINKSVAELEIERRSFLGNKSMKSIIEAGSEEEELFRSVRRLLQELKLQKESNDLLIKQNLNFTNKLLAFINPNRNTATYDARGNFKR